MNQQQPNSVYIFLKRIWPSVYRVINSVLYFLINLIKTMIKDSITMLKGGGSGD